MSRRRQVLVGLALACAGLAGLLAYAPGDEEPAPLSFTIFERAGTERDRPPQDEHASGLRTQEQTGELRFAGEFRGHRVYLGRDDSGTCMFDMHADATGTSCGPSSLAFQQIGAEEGDEKLGFVVVPDGMEWRVYIGRATETRELENVVAVAYDGPLTLRFEGEGRERDVELAG